MSENINKPQPTTAEVKLFNHFPIRPNTDPNWLLEKAAAEDLCPSVLVGPLSLYIVCAVCDSYPCRCSQYEDEFYGGYGVD